MERGDLHQERKGEERIVGNWQRINLIAMDLIEEKGVWKPPKMTLRKQRDVQSFRIRSHRSKRGEPLSVKQTATDYAVSKERTAWVQRIWKGRPSLLCLEIIVITVIKIHGLFALERKGKRGEVPPRASRGMPRFIRSACGNTSV